MFLKDTLRWSLPLFWSAIAAAGFVTFNVMGAAAGDAAFILPLGWAALLLAAVTAILNLMWSK